MLMCPSWQETSNDSKVLILHNRLFDLWIDKEFSFPSKVDVSKEEIDGSIFGFQAAKEPLKKLFR